MILDNAQPEIDLEIRDSSGVIGARIGIDGGAPDPVAGLELRGDSIFFHVDRLQFSGRVRGPRMTFSVLMYNGVTRRPLALVRRPDPADATLRDGGATPRR